MNLKKTIVKKETKKNKKSFKWAWIGMGVLFAVPIATVSLAFIKSPTDNLKNYFTTYDNALDMSLALGIAPDYDTTSSGGKVNYANYLKDYTNDEITKYRNISIFDGQEINRKDISNIDVNTIVLNEWMKADEHKFDNIVNNIAWTSMGDSNETTYFDDQIKTEGAWVFTESVNVSAAFSMLAKDIDNIYKTGSYFTKKASSIIDSQDNRIKKLQSKYMQQNKNKTIGIVKISAANATDIESSVRLFSPSVYPFIYSQKIGRGLGFSFPAPVDSSFENKTHYRSSEIAADSGSELIRQFTNKFDYLIFAKSDTSNVTFDDIKKSNLKNLLKSPNKELTEANSRFGTYGDWYTNAWGIIGVRDILNKFADWFKYTEESSDIWTPTKPSDLKPIRHNQVWG